MQDLKMLEKLEKQARKSLLSQRRILDDLSRLEARDIPDSGKLPNGSKIVFGSYTHTIRGDQVMRRWMVQCPLCKRPCRVLYDLDEHFMCRSCTGLPYRSAISGRTERMVLKLPQFSPFVDAVPDAYLEARVTLEPKLRRDLRKDADYHHRRYHARKTA